MKVELVSGSPTAVERTVSGSRFRAGFPAADGTTSGIGRRIVGNRAMNLVSTCQVWVVDG